MKKALIIYIIIFIVFIVTLLLTSISKFNIAWYISIISLIYWFIYLAFNNWKTSIIKITGIKEVQIAVLIATIIISWLSFILILNHVTTKEPTIERQTAIPITIFDSESGTYPDFEYHVGRREFDITKKFHDPGTYFVNKQDIVIVSFIGNKDINYQELMNYESNYPNLKCYENSVGINDTIIPWVESIENMLDKNHLGSTYTLCEVSYRIDFNGKMYIFDKDFKWLPWRGDESEYSSIND